MKIILIGKPGSGKGTVAKRLAKEYGARHLSTGDLLRAAVRAKTPLGREIAGKMTTGELISDEILMELIAAQDLSDVILDGFPRTLAQAEALSKLGEFRMFELAVSDEVVTDRIIQRMTCSACGEVYHPTFRASIKPYQCDDCGCPLYRRQDDSAAAMARRLVEYHEHTAPILERFYDVWNHRSFDASRPPEKVYQEVSAVIFLSEPMVFWMQKAKELGGPIGKSLLGESPSTAIDPALSELFSMSFGRYDGDDMLEDAGSWLLDRQSGLCGME